MKILLIASTGAALITLVATSAAQAVTFVGSSSGEFGTPDPGSNSNPTYTGVGTNTFTWGNPFNVTNPPNSLSFAGNTFSAETDSIFKVGDLTYFNGTTTIGTNVDSVPLNVTLETSSPTSISEDFAFRFDLVNVPNTGTPEENADFVYPINSFAGSSFEFAGEDYTLELTGFSKDGGATIVDQFNILEDGTDTATVYGRINAAPPETVPESTSTLGLLTFGALGAGSLLKRKR